MTYEVRVQEPDGWITVIHVADDQEVLGELIASISEGWS